MKVFYLLETSTQVDYFNLWSVAGAILGEVPPQYEFLQVFVCVALVFMLCMFIYSPVVIIRCLFDRKK